MLDWDDLRFFLAVTRHRTLSAAAKHLHVTQSTVGRRLATMQSALGVRLLQRTADGFQLTLAGEAILPKAERVEAEALQVEQAVAGRDIRLEGLVRVAIAHIVPTDLLAECLAGVNARNPSIMVEVLACAPGDPLSRNQADVSVQLVRFEHHDLVIRSLGPMQFGLYGSKAYIERCGLPDLETRCAGHHMVALVDDMDLAQHASWLAEHADRAQVVMKCDSVEMQHSAVLCGCGLALLPSFRADAAPTLNQVTSAVPLPPAEIWLGVHRENRHNPRVRVVLEAIATSIRGRAAALAPRSAPPPPGPAAAC